MTVTTLVATLTLPVGLNDHTLSELAQLWNHWSPRDVFERLLVTRILQAVARLELSAQREPLQPDSLWLRHESAADRLFRQSLKALQQYRAENPVDATPIAPENAPIPAPNQPREQGRPASNPRREQRLDSSPSPSTLQVPPVRHPLVAQGLAMMAAVLQPDALSPDGVESGAT